MDRMKKGRTLTTQAVFRATAAVAAAIGPTCQLKMLLEIQACEREGVAYEDQVNAQSTLDYFAATAPKAPDWFKFQPTTPYPYASDGTDPESPEAAQVKAARAAWVREQQEKKFFAWRWHYANQMMAARGGA